MVANLEIVPRDPDEFSLESLRVNQMHVEGVSAKVPISIPCSKPPKFDWIRVHPEMRLDVAAIDMKEEREFYLVDAGMVADLGEAISFVTLYPYINRVGVIRLWPVRLPSPDGRQNVWQRSSAVAADLARRKWIRVAANMSLGAYEVFEAVSQPPDPTWPELTLPEMLKTAFHSRGRIIRDHDHTVVKTLTGRL